MVFIEEIEDRPWEILERSLHGYSGSIPKIIHQSWRSKHIPLSLSSSRQSWEKTHPGWIYILWTDKDIHDYVDLYHPEFKELIRNQISLSSQRAEIMSYIVMYDYGGVYSDLKYVPRRGISGYFTGNNTLYLLYDPVSNSFTNSIMASAPGEEFWADIWRRILKPEVPPWAMGGYLEKKYTTGISMFNSAVVSYEKTFGSLPISLFNPGRNRVTSLMTLSGAGTMMNTEKVVLDFLYEHRVRLFISVVILTLVLGYLVYRFWRGRAGSRNKIHNIPSAKGACNAVHGGA